MQELYHENGIAGIGVYTAMHLLKIIQVDNMPTKGMIKKFNGNSPMLITVRKNKLVLSLKTSNEGSNSHVMIKSDLSKNTRGVL